MVKLARLALPVAGLGLLALAACTPSSPAASPPSSPPATSTTPPVLTTTASSVKPVASTTTQAAGTSGCEVNPADDPVPTADPLEWVPEPDRVRIGLSGVPSGTVKVTGAPVEVDLTVCNNSPVAYPQVAFVFALDHCSCGSKPNGIASGTVQRYDDAAGAWVTVGNSHTGLGQDYLGVFGGQRPLPKGKAVTVRFRFNYDPSMTNGTGHVIGAVVTPDGPHVLGDATLSFTVTH